MTGPAEALLGDHKRRQILVQSDKLFVHLAHAVVPVVVLVEVRGDLGIQIDQHSRFSGLLRTALTGMQAATVR